MKSFVSQYTGLTANFPKTAFWISGGQRHDITTKKTFPILNPTDVSAVIGFHDITTIRVYIPIPISAEMIPARYGLDRSIPAWQNLQTYPTNVLPPPLSGSLNCNTFPQSHKWLSYTGLKAGAYEWKHMVEWTAICAPDILSQASIDGRAFVKAASSSLAY